MARIKLFGLSDKTPDMVLLDLSEAKAMEAARQASDALVKEAKVKEALSPSLFGLTSGDSEDARFRRITSPATLRDLNPVMHERMQQVSFFLKATNLYAQ